MSEQTAEATTETASEAASTTESEKKSEQQPKPAETVDFWKQKAREQEKRAKENADAAKRLAEIEDAQKSESEKVADRIAKAEAEVAAVPTKVAAALRDHLVALHKISDEDAELFLTASEPELLLKQIDRLAERESSASEEKRKRGNHVPGEGPVRTTGSSDPRSADLAQIEADLAAANRR